MAGKNIRIKTALLPYSSHNHNLISIIIKLNLVINKLDVYLYQKQRDINL